MIVKDFTILGSCFLIILRMLRVPAQTTPVPALTHPVGIRGMDAVMQPSAIGLVEPVSSLLSRAAGPQSQPFVLAARVPDGALLHYPVSVLAPNGPVW